MIKINNIYETKWVYDFLIKRWLLKQYKKSKTYISLNLLKNRFKTEKT